MNRNLGGVDVAEMPLQKDVASAAKASPTKAPAPGELGQHLDQTAILLDIDGTLLDLAPTPREVWVPPGLAKTLNRLLARTYGAMALVSGRRRVRVFAKTRGPPTSNPESPRLNSP